jgi:hypothetical protein
MLWPLIGAVVILTTSRFLPGWLCRLVAFGAAVASLMTLWSLRTAAVEGLAIAWEPLSLFRVSPTLRPDGLSLLVGMILAGVTAALVLDSQGFESPATTWHGLILIALSGCLLVTMAGNLLALALGSALLDLTLIAIAATTAGKAGRVAWRMAVPGTASTLLLVLGGVQMDAQVGTVSLFTQNLPVQALILVGVAGVLRLMLFPLHPRGLRPAENATALILSVGAGVYLLARVQGIAPVLADRSWMLSIGVVALLAGGLLTWAGASDSPEDVGQAAGETSSHGEPGAIWLGVAIHQTGLALLFVILMGASVPWPLVGLALALATLAIRWGGGPKKELAPRPRWLAWAVKQLQTWWARAKSQIHLPTPALGSWRRSSLRQRGIAMLPVVALASLAGVPFTAGALGRWPLYGTLLGKGDALVLLAILAADTALAAGLWLASQRALRQVGEYRPKLSALLAMLALTASLVFIGSVPSFLLDPLSLKPAPALGVSRWGVGLIYLLPWLLGGWLARVSSRLGRALGSVRHALSLDWFFQGADWVGQRFVGGLHWLGQVGEGEGWWGWALIILAVAAIFLIAR